VTSRERHYDLLWLPGRYAVCRLPPHSLLTAMPGGPFLTITRTPDELSVVCLEDEAPAGARREGPYALFRVAGAMDLDLTGVLAAIVQPLAAAAVSILAVGTFDTDYVLVRDADRARAQATLAAAGHRFVEPSPEP